MVCNYLFLLSHNQKNFLSIENTFSHFVCHMKKKFHEKKIQKILGINKRK